MEGSAPSCKGLPATCGASGNDDCCKSLLTPGGTYDRSYDGVDYFGAELPGDGERLLPRQVRGHRWQVADVRGRGHGHTEDPAWRWRGRASEDRGLRLESQRGTPQLPADTAALKAALKCYPAYQTWTDTPGSNENKAVNCVDWYTAFAFCAWDGGRMATEAEWIYAASGGSEQRYYPWSSPANLDDHRRQLRRLLRRHLLQHAECRVEVPKGDGQWGHSDLGGNVWEWTLDWIERGPHAVP